MKSNNLILGGLLVGGIVWRIQSSNKNKSITFSNNSMFSPELDYKIDREYTGLAIVKKADDLGKTRTTNIFIIKDLARMKIKVEIYLLIKLSPQIKPGIKTFINTNNPGLSAEIHEHELIHVDLYKEYYQNLNTFYKNTKYSGSITKIIVDIINDNSDIISNAESEKKFNDFITELGNKSYRAIIAKYGSEEKVEQEVNRRLKARYPNKKRFYCDGTIKTIYQK